MALGIRGSHDPTFENTFALFAQPRSGSTWLSEMLKSVPQTVKVDEPLYRGRWSFDGIMPPEGVGKLKELDTLDFYYSQPIPVGAEFAEAERFFLDLFSLKFYNSYLYEETSFTGIPSSQNVLIKFCYGNLLLSWLRSKVDFKAIVMHRNPFSVVSSQLQHDALRPTQMHEGFQIPAFRYSEAYTKYQSILNECSYPEEKLTALWCINYAAVKDLPQDDSLIHVAYERLMLDPRSEIERIFQFLRKPVPGSVWDILVQPSVSSSKQVIDPEQQLKRWKSDLNQNQIKRIGNVLLKFQMDRYEKHILSDFTFMDDHR